MNKREFLKLGGAAALSATLPLAPARARAPAAALALRWLGGATMELDIDGLRILTDPCFGEGKEAFEMGDPNEMFDLSKGPNVKRHERLTPFPGLGHAGYDVVLLSHAHEDHFDQEAQAWLGGNGPLLCPAHDRGALQAKGFAAQALAHGATRAFVAESAKVSITAAPAVHSLNAAVSDMLGLGNGYWIEVEKAGRTTRVYWAGDTFMTDPVAAFLSARPAADLVIPHLGAVGVNGALGQLSMNGAQAVEFVARSGAARALPVHHSTYALYQEGIDAMQSAYGASALGAPLTVLREGQAITL
ncbi:MAG: MBL fold metallo-hydrolase [Paracoccaceae bacterium]